MTAKATLRQAYGVTIVDLEGHLTLGNGSALLRDKVKDLLGKGHRHVVLDLGNVTYIDSSGAGVLVSAYTSLRNQGGELTLLNLTKKVRALLQFTRPYILLDVKDDEPGRWRRLEGIRIPDLETLDSDSQLSGGSRLAN